MSSIQRTVPTTLLSFKRSTLLLGMVLIGVCIQCGYTSYVTPGKYRASAVQACGEENKNKLLALKLEVDRSKKLLTFTLDNKSQITIAFQEREQKNWPTGCPTQLYSSAMEVLELQKEEWTLDGCVFKKPILVANCPPNTNRVYLVLREDGVFNSAGGACTGDPLVAKCMTFESEACDSSKAPCDSPTSPTVP